MEDLVNTLSAGSRLVELVGGQDARRIGMTLKVSYDEAIVLVNDHWRVEAGGLPHNSLLLGAAFGPQKLASANPIDRQLVLFRIVGRADIENDQASVRALTEYFQEKPTADYDGLGDMERLTRAQLQWSGIKCKILGSLRLQGSDLVLSSDVGDFFAARPLVIYKPHADALEQIVNYVDPKRKKRAEQAARNAGKALPEPFQIGTVRYASTLYGKDVDDLEGVPVMVDPSDFLSRRTGVFGMTRTGKSNTTKTMVSAVLLNALRTDQAVGQLIFDINGEYANANNKDGGSAINEVFADNTVRYRARHTPGFRDLRINFYDDIAMALDLIRAGFDDQNRSSGGNDLKNFLNARLAKPEDPNDFDLQNRWARKASIFRAILYAAGYTPDAKNRDRQEFPISKEALADIIRRGLQTGHLEIPTELGVPGDGEDLKVADQVSALSEVAIAFFNLKMTRKGGWYSAELSDAKNFWVKVREISKDHEIGKTYKKSAPSEPWLNEEEMSFLSILIGRSSVGNRDIISGSAIYGAGSDYHGPAGSGTLVDDVYELLSAGRIVILDLSVGHPDIREKMAKKLIKGLFDKSSSVFNQANDPPKIVVYVEEAHNLIGKKAELSDTWPRLAKEGAKFDLALVYATQEPSSVHANIMANTENFFITHLNNDDEIRSISKYNDFADFARSIKTCSDVGFARVKTLSAPFVVPTQILEFKPNEILAEYSSLKKAGANTWFRPLDETSKSGATQGTYAEPEPRLFS